MSELKCAHGVRWLPSAVLITIFVASGCSRDAAASRRRYVESGDSFMAGGKLAEAVLEYRNALVSDPLAGDVRVKLGSAYLGTGDVRNALFEFVQAADLRPDDLGLQLKTGNLLLLAGRFDDAKGRAEKVLAKDPGDVNAQILLASALAGLKDVDGAVAQIEEALRLAPDRSGTYSNLGALELGRGRRDLAEAAFKKAVALDPASIPAHLALGNFYWLTERPELAEESLTRALDLDRQNTLTNRAVANFFLTTNRLEQAERPLRAVYEISRTPDAGFALADYYVAAHREADARAVLEPLLADARTSAKTNVRLAALDFSGGRYSEALKRLTIVLEKDPANLQALLVKSSVLVSQGNPDEALVSAHAAVHRYPDSASAFFALARVETSRRQPANAIAAYQEVLRLNPRATAAKIALGQLQLGEGRTEVSVGLAAEALSSEPANGNAQLLYVRGLLAQGELQRAEAQLRLLATRFPDAAMVHTQMGMLFGRQGKLSAARTELIRAMELQPDDFEAFGGLVAVDLAERNFEHARRLVDTRLAAGPRTAPLLALAAGAYRAAGDLASAEQRLNEAIELDSGYLAGYAALGQLYLSQKRLDAAQAAYEAMFRRSPKSVSALTMVGVILQVKGDIDGAREHFERVLQIDPDAAVAANDLAWIYTQQGGNLDVAMQLAQTAQKRLPGVAEVNDTLGYIYYKKNLPALAIATLKLSTEKDPNNALYHYHMGLAYTSAGDAARAHASLSRALSLKPDFEGSEHAKTLLGSGTLH